VTVALAPEADVDGVVADAATRGVGSSPPTSRRPLLLVGYANIAEEDRAGRCRLAAAVRR
jgi:hypothetical protein